MPYYAGIAGNVSGLFLGIMATIAIAGTAIFLIAYSRIKRP